MGMTKMVPRLRFPEFTNEWEQRKVGDVFDYLQNNTLSRAELNSEGGVAKNVHYGDVLIKFGEYLDASEEPLPFISSQLVADKFKSSLLHDGDVIMADTAEDATVGKCTEIAGLQGFPTISGLHTIPLRPKWKFATGYLGFYMNSSSYHEQLKPLMQGIKVTSVSKSAIQDTVVSYPVELAEQECIAQMFINLDKAITLHQRKLDTIKQYKQGMLQKMFPKEGKKVPEIRFPNFTGDWEQRKCEGILKPAKGAMKIGPFGSALKKEFYTETGVKVYAQENIFQEDFTIGNYYISEERYQTLKGCKLEPGDLVISMMGTIGACAIFPENAEPGIMNSHLLRLQLNDDIHPEYIHQLLRDSQIIRSQIDRLSVGSIMSGLSSSVVQKLVFPIPSLDEQKKIAELLSQLDKAITLHQRKLDQIKLYKQGLLQQMFA